VRFPGFDPVNQSSHWDPVTAETVLARLAEPAPFRFFTPDERATATALCDLLLDQAGDRPVPVAQFIDARLADVETDGWRYSDMALALVKPTVQRGHAQGTRMVAGVRPRDEGQPSG
jgi:hypothetical protein